MSTAAVTSLHQIARPFRLTPPVRRAAGLAALVAVGSLVLYPLWFELFTLWSQDPLRSIGAAFPVFATLGVLAAWHRLGWAANGSWWGLLPIAIALPLARLTFASVAEIVVHGVHIGLVHPGFVFLLYGGGAVLLFGGWPLLRAALPPLLLLLAVNPVPFGYNKLVDLPLQELSANTARAFAHFIGLRPTGEQLKMMFAPDFGMLIVPGCNGVRGSITFAYLALIFGYSRSLRPRTLALVTGSAFLLGYALNLLRLCVLVVYYRIGLSFPAIQDYGVGVDYAIGCTIFLLATLTLGLLIRSLEPPANAVVEPIVPPARALIPRVLCFLAVVLLFLVPQLRVLASPPRLRPSLEACLRALPANAGPYHLTRSYYEQFADGNPTLVLGDYLSGSGPSASRLTLALWIAGANHSLALSRLVQGTRARQSGSLQAVTSTGQSVALATSLYDDGITREFDAEASCSTTSCADHMVASSQGTLLFQSPAFKDFLVVPTGKRLPIYVQRTWLDSDPAPTAALATQFDSDTRSFLSHLDLTPLVTQLGTRP